MNRRSSGLSCSKVLVGFLDTTAGEGLSARTLTHYEFRLRQWIDFAGDATAALLLTTKAFSGRAAFSDPLANSITRNTFEQAVKSVSKQGFFFFKRKARNTSEIGAKIEQLARFYIQPIGLGAKDAVEEAAERIKESHTIINGWAIDTGNTQVPPNIAVISELIIKSYVEEFGEEEGVDEDDLALIPGETEATWILFNQQVLMPVESWRDKGIFTNADLRRIAESETLSIREGIIHEQIPNIGSLAPTQGVFIPRLAPLRIGPQSRDALRGPGRRGLLMEGLAGEVSDFTLAPPQEEVVDATATNNGEL